MERIRQSTPEWLRSLPLTMALLIGAIAAADALIALRLPSVSALQAVLRHYAAISDMDASLSSMTAASLLVLAIAATGALLRGFVRAFFEVPFLGLAPPLIGFAALVIAHSSSELPIHLTPTIFAGFCAFFWFAGGAMLGSPERLHKAVGGFLLALPVLIFAVAYAAASNVVPATRDLFDARAQLVLLMLVVATIGTGLIALARPERQGSPASDSVIELTDWRSDEPPMAASDVAATPAAERDAEDHAELAALRAKPGLELAIWSGLLALLLGYFAGTYFGGRSVRAELDSERAAFARLSHEAARERQALEQHHARERAALEQRLVAAESAMFSPPALPPEAAPKPVVKAAAARPRPVPRPAPPTLRVLPVPTPPPVPAPTPFKPPPAAAPSRDGFEIDLRSQDPLEGL